MRENFLECKEALRSAGIDSPEADARLLLQEALHISREDFLLDSSRMVSFSEEHILAGWLQRRLKREPVSRIIGRRAFWKSEFKISPQTLDPRPDSETIIESALRFVKDAQNRPLKMVDLGTGTGCLLLSLLLEWPLATGKGVDISQGAIDTASDNAKNLDLQDRVQFSVGDWNALPRDRSFNVLLSNPPYIPEDEIRSLAPEVALYDPQQALSGGRDGLDCYRSIAGLAHGLLAPAGWMFLEIGHAQAGAAKELLEQEGISVLETVPDLAGNDRCIVARVS